MANDSTSFRQNTIDLLGRIIGDQPLPPDLQRQSLEILAAILVPQPAAMAADPAEARALSAVEGIADMRIPTLAAGLAAAAAIGNRRLIYVHGICRHVAGFSNPWWNALHPFVPSAFGSGLLGQTRLEVIWSDLVNRSAAAAATPGLFAAGAALSSPAAAARQRIAEEIKEALRDRADQHVFHTAMRIDGLAAAPQAAANMSGLISIPGLNCIDDFSIYLADDEVRQQIINRFINVVRPELQAGRELDIISHSWGTVVAYEALLQLEDEGVNSPHIRNFFTVGAALSIGPVKSRLRDANKDGRKPVSVRRWVNLDAHGDLIGGPLKGRPFAVDLDFVNLVAVGCSFLGIVNPLCAHGSYFEAGNTTVNRDLFAHFIDEP